MSPVLLVTNDDGIESRFLRALVAGLQAGGFDVRVAAPTGEQSWIARALSRWRDVRVHTRADLGCPAWALDGTPTDCVNIALGHLLPERPAAVVSGINLRENVSLPYILSSGTIAGALEGALWGLPALAFSLQLPDAEVAAIRAAHGGVEGTTAESLACAASRAADFVRERLANPPPPHAHIVDNVNFPFPTRRESTVVRTRPGRLRLGGLFVRENAEHFRFRFSDEHEREEHPDADHDALDRGCISHSVLDYAILGSNGDHGHPARKA